MVSISVDGVQHLVFVTDSNESHIEEEIDCLSGRFFVIFAVGTCKSKNMKRALLTLTIVIAGISAYAQPRSAGIRLGASGFEADYLHDIRKNLFIEGNLGLDFGVSANSHPGIKATAVYNFIWARPAWTDQGSWALYAGPGATIGYVHDTAHFTVGKEVYPYNSGGFMLGVCAQVGLEYSFWFPLQLSVDLRPTVAMHVSGSHSAIDPVTGESVSTKARAGFYDAGLIGFVPTISVRYRF